MVIVVGGREYELDKKLESYYKYILEGYDDWVYNIYNKSEVITLNMDEVDVLNNIEHRRKFIDDLKKIKIKN